MVRALAVAAVAVAVVFPFGADAARGDLGERYWTEARARKVRAERSAAISAGMGNVAPCGDDRLPGSRRCGGGARLADPAGAARAGPRTVRLAVRIARHLAAGGWQNPALPDDLAEAGALLNLPPAGAAALVRRAFG